MNDDHKALCKFYDVETLEQLVDAQSAHIEKLQQSLRKADPYRNAFPRSPREG